jgi:hypothetical protein
VRPADAEIAKLLRELANSATALAYEMHGQPATHQMNLAADARAAADQLTKE